MGKNFFAFLDELDHLEAKKNINSLNANFSPFPRIFPGSFGLWGSLLAGGEVIAAKGTSNLMLSEEDRVYLRSGMPGWLYLDTRDKNNVVVLQVNTTTQTFIPAV